MFEHSLDNRKTVTTPDGDQIVDLTAGIFNDTNPISSYIVRKVPEKYIMRPDLVSLVEYGTTDYTEYIMMFNQCGNPFSMNEEDVLMIPDKSEATDMLQRSTMASGLNASDSSIQEILIKNYYRFTDASALLDVTTYENLVNKQIPQPTAENNNPSIGNISARADTSSVSAPYLLKDGESAVMVKNGRIYFNTENNSDLNSVLSEQITPENIDTKLQELITGLDTSLSGANCSYNGTLLSDFIKATNDSNK